MSFPKGLLLSACCLVLASAATAKGLTPSMVRRNGLTDEQIDHILSADTNAALRLTAAQWRNISYRLYRFDNMKAWLNEQIEGRLGDRLLSLSDANAELVSTNRTLRASCDRLAEDARLYFNAFTNQVSQTAVQSNLCARASLRATAAAAKIDDEIADLEAKVSKYEGYRTKYPLLKTIWTAMIADANKRIATLRELAE